MLMAPMVLVLTLALGGCVGRDWFSARPAPAQVLEKARQVSRGETTLIELKDLALQARLGSATGEAGSLCPFDKDRNDKLSDEEILNLIVTWNKGQSLLTDQQVLRAIALWVANASIDCYDAPPGFGGGFDRIAARDAAIRYIHQTDPQSGIPREPDWWETDITPPELVGSKVFSYVSPYSRCCRILVRYPLVLDPVYRVEVTNYATGRTWELNVSSTGEVTLIPPGFGGGGFDRIAARDATIRRVYETDPQSGIPLDVIWNEEDITPEGTVGSAVFRYTWPSAAAQMTGGICLASPSCRAYRAWRIWVRYPVVPQPNYRVEVMNLATSNYWGFTVLSTGQVEPSPLKLAGTVIVHARDSRSESWGIVVTRVPPEYGEYKEYMGKHIGLKSWTEMKSALAEQEGKTITVDLPKICLPFAEGCCQCAKREGEREGFEFCAPAVYLTD
jgi:hypothetical protein